MKKLKSLLNYFTKFELCLWGFSIFFIVASFLAFDRSSYLSLAASLIGVTSLIFCAKGNPFGEALMIVFGIIYGVISLGFAYYGEMITYLGMTVPMSIVALVSWLRNPYGEGKAEVRVNKIKPREILLLTVLTVAVTVLFYFILKFFGTANLLPSTVSVTTSFIAVYLTARRSVYFTLAYAANDAVLIVLWLLATLENPSYVSVFVCFIVFFVNDIYGFVNWRRMEKRQLNIK